MNENMAGKATSPRADVAILACGALAREILDMARRHGWHVDMYALPAILHNRPRKIAPAVEEKLTTLATRYRKVIVAYGDCGTAGMLDSVLEKFPNARRISGPHCYEMYGGEIYERQAEEKPGTFFLTDFLAQGFHGLVWKDLGLTRFPQLKDTYFGHYTDVMWLSQNPTPRLEQKAREAADLLSLPLTVVHTGYGPLEERLRELIEEWEPTTEQAPQEASSPRAS